MLLKTTLLLTLLLVTIALVVHFVGQTSWRSSIQLLQTELTGGGGQRPQALAFIQLRNLKGYRNRYSDIFRLYWQMVSAWFEMHG